MIWASYQEESDDELNDGTGLPCSGRGPRVGGFRGGGAIPTGLGRHAGRSRRSQNAEEPRSAPIDGQAPPANQMRPQFTWPDPRYAPTPAETYRLGYIYGPRRMYRQAVRLGYPPVAVAVPRVPTDFFGYPMYGPVRSPLGVDKSWTGPSGYNYSSAYTQSPQVQGQLLPPRPGVPTPAARPFPGAPNVALPPEPAPEPIPTPPSEAGPREF